MYYTPKYQIKQNHPLFQYCDTVTALVNNLSNAVCFRQRQLITSSNKTDAELSDNERSVLEELTIKELLKGKRKKSLSYVKFDNLFKATRNQDYFADELSRHTAQHTIKACVANLNAFYRALAEYKACPAKFTGKPELPGYHRKGGHTTATISNQEAVIREKDGYYNLKLPRTKITLGLGKFRDDVKLKEVKIYSK